MKKLNNKGMTLMELLVSIVLVSMVLVFMVQLVTDLKNETNNNNYAYSNQVNRTDAIYTIQKDLMNTDYVLTGVKNGTNSTTQTQIYFYYQSVSGTSTKIAVLTMKEVTDADGNAVDYLTYAVTESGTTTNYTWEMKGATVDMCGAFTFYETTDYNVNDDETTSKYYFKLNIYLYNSSYQEGNNAGNNNAVDDIEITYEGDATYLTNSINYLTYASTKGEPITKSIGKCS